jgi:murein DD-endopeptidase MepM/ murein hydrolase activator NlpD
MKIDRKLTLLPKHKARLYAKCYFGILLCLVITVTGFLLNHISTELLFRRIETEGINYDAFRELKLSDNMLHVASRVTQEILRKQPKLQKQDVVSPIKYLTFQLLVRDFNLYDQKPISTSIYLQGIGRLGSRKGYQKLYQYNKAIFSDLKYFPVPILQQENKDITYCNSWSELRNYGGNRRHEGTDIMAGNNIRGHYPIISMTEGTVEKLGWLEQGGYRIGIRSPSGGYFYYAHLASYAQNLSIGDAVIAGQLLGFMGDSGYGSEGTVGKFDVHLHLGIYVNTEAGEMSVNPYYILKILEKNRTIFVSD